MIRGLITEKLHFSTYYRLFMGKRAISMHPAYDNLIKSIEAFFDYARPAQHQKTIRSMLRAVQKNDIWKKRDPASLLEFADALGTMITAVYHFEQKAKTGKNGLFPAEKVIDPAIFNGFQAFFRFQGYKRWQKQLQVILYFALSTNSHLSLGVEIDLLGTYIQLTSLIEHCHQLFLANTGKKEP